MKDGVEKLTDLLELERKYKRSTIFSIVDLKEMFEFVNVFSYVFIKNRLVIF